ncbi:MAG: capsule biosynthesis GfcC family protein [Pseudomonadota bacterium]
MKLKAIISLSLLVAGSVNAAVTVQLADKTLRFADNPDLATVLTEAGYNQYSYWPEAKLFSRDTLNRNQPVLQRTLTTLETLSSKAPELQGFYRYLAQSAYAFRVPLRLDIDLARIEANANPRFDSGDYVLQLGGRSGRVTVTGAVARAADYELIAGKTVADYIQMAKPLALADDSIAWLITPDANKQRLGVAYWNNEQTLPGSGAVIYVPFDTGVPAEQLTQLNNEVLQLLINRIEL